MPWPASQAPGPHIRKRTQLVETREETPKNKTGKPGLSHQVQKEHWGKEAAFYSPRKCRAWKKEAKDTRDGWTWKLGRWRGYEAGREGSGGLRDGLDDKPRDSSPWIQEEVSSGRWRRRGKEAHGQSVRRPLTICARFLGCRSLDFSGELAHGARAIAWCTSQGVPWRLAQGGGPSARGCDRRPGGRSMSPPRASATPRETSRRARGFQPLKPPDSPSSLPTGCDPDTASQRRRALSRSKRSPSGSRPSRSSELLYDLAPPLSAFSTVSNAGYSIFPASSNRPIAAHESWSREMWLGRWLCPAKKSREVWAPQAPLRLWHERFFLIAAELVRWIRKSVVPRQPPSLGQGRAVLGSGFSPCSRQLWHFSFCSHEGPVIWEYSFYFTSRATEAQNLEMIYSRVRY